ncbi:MAG: hypothetical protein AAF944_21175 [Bacteroidota bacterium]
MGKSNQKIDVNIIIRVDDPLKESLPSPDITVDETGKVTTPLSVAQLAYIFRVFVETKTLEADNLSNLFRFVAENIRTTRQEEISFDSIRNKFYQTTETAKESVLDLFVSQVSYIQKDIGS